MLPQALQTLIQTLKRLPGIGPKSAERLTYYLMKQPDSAVEELVTALKKAKSGTRFCRQCFNISDRELCSICNNSSRDQHQICVVEEPWDVYALEHSGAYKGLYHVLHGAISPLDGIGPEQLKIAELMKRLEETEAVKEVILATNPNLTGEATAMYLSRQIKPRGLKLTHLAQGLPMGGSLEFADPDTLKRALVGRRE